MVRQELKDSERPKEYHRGVVPGAMGVEVKTGQRGVLSRAGRENN